MFTRAEDRNGLKPVSEVQVWLVFIHPEDDGRYQRCKKYVGDNEPNGLKAFISV